MIRHVLTFWPTLLLMAVLAALGVIYLPTLI